MGAKKTLKTVKWINQYLPAALLWGGRQYYLLSTTFDALLCILPHLILLWGMLLSNPCYACLHRGESWTEVKSLAQGHTPDSLYASSQQSLCTLISVPVVFKYFCSPCTFPCWHLEWFTMSWNNCKGYNFLSIINIDILKTFHYLSLVGM